MKRLPVVACLILFPMAGGCAVSDAIFAIFGDHYSGGGSTRAEKEYDYNQRLEASRDYDSARP